MLRLRSLQEHPSAYTSSAEEEASTADTWSVERCAGREGNVMIGAFAGHILVGTGGVERQPRAKQRHKATVYGMYVAPEHGGRGIGQAVLEALLATARGWGGIEQVQLTVTTDNAPAERLYRAAGFRSFGRERRAIKVGDAYYDKDHMVLFLD